MVVNHEMQVSGIDDTSIRPRAHLCEHSVERFILQVELLFTNTICLYSMIITYASKYVPIIASVSEHQPATWPSYFMDIHFGFPSSSWPNCKSQSLLFLSVLACFLPLSNASSLDVLFIVTSMYFSGVMVGLMLVFAPAGRVMAGIALSGAEHQPPTWQSYFMVSPNLFSSFLF
ncbi:hypothetical protein MKW92_018822 [Papaver armeniacum]|nr:hypothetical protein MKW92_018822 [Papaver armeniacum]